MLINKKLHYVTENKYRLIFIVENDIIIKNYSRKPGGYEYEIR